MSDIDFDAMAAARQEAQDAVVSAKVLAAVGKHSSIKTTVSFPVRPPLVLESRSGYGYAVQVTEVEISSELFAGDSEPVVRARGWCQRLTKKGEVSERESRAWQHLPNDLVAPLFGRAFTAGGTA